ncbi:hypothetical protein D3878_01365 [Noviherbaspirillum sedimenti]|uniref:Uncharacterized protein n=2 Tax=Noviherbaspirillum sedimenti TaxID=2320865 RepID=A0A3A3G1N8_9BURK|nr:hypothetical protein D3878_01365 [Noviherbaspirillum sedimenti]
MSACALEPPASAAAALQARHIELQAQLRTNTFGESLYLSSREGSNRLEGDVYAEVTHPVAEITATFRSANRVCELLFLHLNVRGCQPAGTSDNAALTLSVGPKRALAAGKIYHITYALRVEAADAAYFRATLSAAQGPLSTRDYRIVFEAMPIGGSRSFVHFSYAYGYGTMAKIAMRMYLATAGRSKIGFTVTGQSPDGRPLYVGGERGSLERNVMRYYLALLAYSSVNTGSPQEKMEKRMRKWFALTERYPAQLHELDLDEYLQEKQADLARAAAGHQ